MTMLLFTAVILIIGFSLGYGAREVISQGRRVRARQYRKVFYEGHSAKEDRYPEIMSLEPNKENSAENQITQAPRRPLITRQRVKPSLASVRANSGMAMASNLLDFDDPSLQGAVLSLIVLVFVFALGLDILAR